ncbi:retrovirus-related pol polyprotein from transposon TNT 1-94 [Tanacetum coccineum]|uniref:Retrovirus-related pol polyprotein from transposon TNT 1-94 n=1 Tax=Tanacetum coccineum TaxID=301880 RepID=A0ABQ5EYT5_9ASTR
MSSNSDDIQAAGSDTRPPMLDRTDYESWSQRIRLYCRGKENGLQILQSIDQGPFELGTTRDTLGTTSEGGVLLGPERPRTYDDLNDDEKKRYDADVRATNIVLQGLPKDIYKLINHNIEAKAIWDNVKMLLAGSELTKEDRESQLYDEFERFRMLPGENINEYYVRFHKLVNDMRNIRMTMPNIQLNSKFVNNMSPEWDRFVTAVKLNKGLKETNHEQLYAYLKQHEKHAAQDRLIIERITPSTNDPLAFVSSVQPYSQPSQSQSHQYQSSTTPPQSQNVQSIPYSQFAESSSPDSGYTQIEEILNTLSKQFALIVVQNVQGRQNQNQRNFARGNGAAGFGGMQNRAGNANAVLDEEELLFLAGEQGNTFDADVDNQPVQDLALNEDNIFQADECDAFDSDVDDEPTAQTIFMANLSSARSTNPQAGPSNALILSESELPIGAQNPFYLKKAKVAQPALYDGNELINLDHDPIDVPSSEEDLELAELTRQKMHEKLNDPVCVEKGIKCIPPNYSKENFLATFTPQTQLTPEQVFWSLDLAKRKAEELKANAPPLPVLPPATVYPPNTPVHLVPRTLPTTSQVNISLYVITQLFWDFEKTCKKRITPTGITEGERGFEQTKRCYLTEVIPFFNLLKEHFDGVQKSLVTEVRAMKAVFEEMEAEVDQNAIDKKYGEIERKNLLITNENLIANCIAQDVFYTVTDSTLSASRFNDLSTAYNAAMNRVVDLESENSRLLGKIEHDDHDTMIKAFSKLEVAHVNLQLKQQHLKENANNLKTKSPRDVPEFDVFFELGMRDDQIQSHKNTIRKLKAQISELKANKSDNNQDFKAENAKIKLHYQELFNSIKVTRAQTTEKAKSLQNEIENLRTQLKGKMPCVASDVKTPKVSAFEKYAIDVEPIPLRLKKNREVHLHYIKRLKENVETLREIVEDAKNAYTNLLRKKRVNFVEPCETSTHDTPPQVEYQKINSTNASGIPSTGVKGASAASGSKPRSNTKKDRTLPARSALKQVEAHSRMNKSNEKQENRVDSSISSKRTVINSNSNSLCKTCNECLISSNHVKCVERFLKSYNKPPVTQIWRVKQVKQTWKPTGKIFTTIGYHWKSTGRIFPLGDQCPLTRITKPKALPVKQWKPTGRLIPLDGQCPLVRPPAPTNSPNPVASNLVVQIVLWYLDSGCSKHMTGDRSRLRNFVKKFIGTVRFGNDHFGAIMGYGDYVTVFELPQKAHMLRRGLSCVDLTKGSRGMNLYTISIDDMMRSSPICLLSKASKNKSWLWHRRLNHLNFGTLNDLARKDLVRGLPRLKFKKDHLCSTCQLGKSRKATHKP